MTAREELAAILRAGVPADWRIVPYDEAPVIDRPTLIVYRESVEAGPTWAVQKHTLAIHVLNPAQTAPKSSDKADEMLDVVLGVLDDAPNLIWQSAEFGIFNDTYVQFKIGVEMTTRKDF